MTRILFCACAAAVIVCATPMRARAEVTSDQAAAILVFPKVVVDISSPQISPPNRIDTLIRVSNTSNRAITLRCFWVDATPHCSDNSGSCLSTPMSCKPGMCESQWRETDFVVNITARQPVAWLASRGAGPCEGNSLTGVPCFPLGANDLPSPTNNGGSRVLPVPEDPFVGELKCIAVDQNFVPVERNDLKGEVEIIRSSSNPDNLDVEAYNAIGIPAIPGTNNNDDTLVLGGGICNGGAKNKQPCTSAAACPGGRCSAEYSSCPNLLILDHFFDGATDPVSGKTVMTELTLVPCTEDFLTQSPVFTTVQFLVFNEFEQRFSTSRRGVSCFFETKISNIDTLSKDRSLFSAAVAGTLTGQTRIRGVADQDTDHGHTLLGVVEEFRQGGGTAAFNLHFQGSRPQSDFVYVP